MSIEMDNRLHALERRVIELERRITAMSRSRADAGKAGDDVESIAPSLEQRPIRTRRAR